MGREGRTRQAFLQALNCGMHHRVVGGTLDTVRCIYCLDASGTSRSVEHVIPESLGNTKLVLSPGVVCDRCNNYLSRKVEGPFLNSFPIRKLRFDQAVPNKRGRVPRLEVAVAGGGPAVLARAAGGPIVVAVDRAVDVLDIAAGSRSVLLGEEFRPPEARVWSRFVGKVALGFLAASSLQHMNEYEWIVETREFDELRNHVRWGARGDWQVQVRRIYHPDTAWADGIGTVQRTWEATLFETSDGLPHFTGAFFGLECTICLTQPDLSTFRRELLISGGESPLYAGRHRADWLRRRGLGPNSREALIAIGRSDTHGAN